MTTEINMKEKHSSLYEFYLKQDCEIHDLSEVQRCYEKKNGDISFYRGNMFCPECQQAALSFTCRTSKHREYLSTLPTSKHKNDCLYQYESISTEQVERCLKRMTDKEIKDKLEAMLNRLLRVNMSSSNSGETQAEHPCVFNVSRGNSGRTVKRALIPHNFSRSLKILDQNEVRLFYGRVRISVESFVNNNTQRENYRLIVNCKVRGGESQLVEIYRGMTKDNIDETALYDLAVIGYLINTYGKTSDFAINSKFKSIMFRKVAEKNYKE